MRHTPALYQLCLPTLLIALAAAGCVPTGSLSSDRPARDGATDDVLVLPADDDAAADAEPADAAPTVDGGADAVGDPPTPPEPEPPEPDPEPMPDPEPVEPEPPADPCVDVACVLNAVCTDGMCDCLPGFVPEGDACVSPPQSPLEMRTEEAVCDRWRSDRINVGEGWAPTGAGGECDPGTITAAAQQNALRRTNLYRWLAGAEPVTIDDSLLEQQQACAAIQVALGGLDHGPGPGAPCYTDAGARGAGSSNLSGGAGVADSVELYVGDRGVASLGHRRWVINPTARTTAFGWKSRYSCMYSFSSGRPHTVEVMAWPPPGPVPVDIPRGAFSVQLYGVRPGPDFTIAVGVDGAAPSPVAATRLPDGYGGRDPAYSFSPGEVFAAGRVVEVVLDGLVGADPIRWRTRFVDCR